MDPVIQLIYDTYPRRTNKPAAFKAINKAIKNEMSGKTKIQAVEHVLAATSRFANEWRALLEAKAKDIKFCPHPASWFNAEGYNEAPFARNPEAEALMKPKTASISFDDAMRVWLEIDQQFGIKWGDGRYFKKEWSDTWKSLPAAVRAELKELCT